MCRGLGAPSTARCSSASAGGPCAAAGDVRGKSSSSSSAGAAGHDAHGTIAAFRVGGGAGLSAYSAAAGAAEQSMYGIKTHTWRKRAATQGYTDHTRAAWGARAASSVTYRLASGYAPGQAEDGGAICAVECRSRAGSRCVYAGGCDPAGAAHTSSSCGGRGAIGQQKEASQGHESGTPQPQPQ